MRQARWIGTLLAVLLPSCAAEKLRNQQLEKVAKDWSLVIRASQVIPVYPLTEDLQPGDVLLVSTPIEEQVSLYKEKGFLPLDQHLVRLDLDGYDVFYRMRYGIGPGEVPPGMWQIQDPQKKTAWHKAPRAAFPSYQFSVQTGAGLNLAIPIQGVPFALGLMNSGKASGTVTLTDAHTFGLDQVSLDDAVRRWAATRRSLLSGYAPQGDRRHFLRLISRVYVIGQVGVTIHNDEATSADVAAGADKPVNLLTIEEGQPVKNYQDTIAAVNALAEKALPGGRLRIATATSRAVTMDETFDRPLVIGYVGFDLPILAGGRLGAPISTLSQLTETPTLEAFPAETYVYRLAAMSHVWAGLEKIPGERADEIRGDLDRLAQLLPRQYPFTAYDQPAPAEVEAHAEVQEGADVPRAGFADVLAYQGYASHTVEVLENYLKKAPRGTDAEKARAAELERALTDAKAALTDFDARLEGEPVLEEAVGFVFFGQ